MTMVITGANRGLGYETALALAANTMRTLVLAGRDRESLDATVARIRAATGNRNLVPMWLDLADLAAVRAFAAELGARELPPLTALICNAGVSRRDVQARSADGYELTFAVNHLGHFLLVNLLLETLQPPARILIVSSGAHNPAEAGGPMQPPRYVKAEWLAFPERDPGLPQDESKAGNQAYATSKLCNVLHAYELARRLQESGLSTPERPVTVNAFDPGFVPGTGLARRSSGLTRLMWYHLLPALAPLVGFVRTAERAGGDLAHLATAPALEQVSGRYFSGREMVESSPDSHDREKATDLWQTSVRLSGLQQEETVVPLHDPSPTRS